MDLYKTRGGGGVEDWEGRGEALYGMRFEKIISKGGLPGQTKK